MSFGTNLQWLRKMCGGMTQEELAEKMEVSRQTISKWELETAYPEIGKIKELCQLFSCSMDRLFMEDMTALDGPYSDIRVEQVEGFRYVQYAVISPDPEADAIRHVQEQAAACGVAEPEIIGWDFPHVSQEQINVFHMHGYAAAWILPEGQELPQGEYEVRTQPPQKYAAITIDGPFNDPFRVIPNAYRALMAYMTVNRLEHREDREIIPCFEKEYQKDGREFMDIFIAAKE